MANDIITQLQARNETLTQAIARYGSLNARTLLALSSQQATVIKLTQQLADSALRLEENSRNRADLMEKTQTFAGQFSKVFNVEVPDWKLPYEFQDNMVNLATKGGMNDTTRETLSLNLRDWSMDFNQQQTTLQNAAQVLIEGNLSSMQDLNRYMPEIAKAATTTRESAETWANAALATHDRLNIAPENFHAAQNMMYGISKNGGPTVAGQTQWIDKFAVKTGAQGLEGMAELTATMQIAMKNGASASVAAENFDHFLQTIFSKKTDNWFVSQGVDLQGSLLEHQQNGMGVSEAMIHIVQTQLEKMNPAILDTFKRTMQIEDLSARSNALQSMVTQFNLGEMFGDAQTVEFLAPVLANMEEYRQLKASTMQDSGKNLIDNDFSVQMALPIEQTKTLQLALNDLWLSIGLQLMPLIGELAQSLTPVIRQFSAWLREHPALMQNIAKIVGAIWLFNGALNVLKLGANVIASPFIRLVDIFLKVRASLTLTGAASKMLSAVNSLYNGAKWLTQLLGRGLIGALKLAGQTVFWLGRVLLMNPIGLVITAIAGAAYLIYRHWEPISRFFSAIWQRITTAFDGGIAGICRLILDWSPLELFYSAFSSVMNWFGVEMPASFSEFGSNLLGSLVDGIMNAFPALKGIIDQVKNALPDWLKTTMGISTEGSATAVTSTTNTASISPTTVVPGVAGAILTPPVGKQLAPSSKTTTSPSTPAAKNTAAKPASASLPGKSVTKPATLPSRSSGKVQVNFSPQITVQSNGQNTTKDIQNVLTISKRELERMINDVMAQQQRRGYA
ncbi:phage tail tape measure protein [Escherichia albertii]|uniref:phage tail tape measure protein n=1 Tax=Escherichia albertii TaxID=208962 RepID=UPI000CF6DA93|nr:phage tail tape measure protein [Escherichia albertii]